MPAFNQTLNLDSIDAVDTRRPRTVVKSAPVSTTADSSPLFPAAPIYARTSTKKKASGNLALLVGAPVVLVAAGALAWMIMANPAQTPATEEQPSAEIAAADTAPLTPPLPPAAAMPAPVTAPTQTAAIETPTPRAAAPVRAAPRATVARRAAPARAVAPDADTASSNVSATVPAPPPAVVAEPAPVVIAAPAAPAPTPVVPVAPQ